jgi:hypothetical protein
VVRGGGRAWALTIVGRGRVYLPHQNRRFFSLSRPARFFGGKHRFYGGKGIGRGPVSPDMGDGREDPALLVLLL